MIQKTGKGGFCMQTQVVTILAYEPDEALT